MHILNFKKSRNLQKCLWIYFLLAIFFWVFCLPLRAVFFFFTVRLPWRKLNFYLQMVICFFPYSLSCSSPFPIPTWSSIPVSPCQIQNIYFISNLYRDLSVPPVLYSTSSYYGSMDCLNRWDSHISKHIPYCIAS